MSISKSSIFRTINATWDGDRRTASFNLQTSEPLHVFGDAWLQFTAGVSAISSVRLRVGTQHIDILDGQWLDCVAGNKVPLVMCFRWTPLKLPLLAHLSVVVEVVFKAAVDAAQSVQFVAEYVPASIVVPERVAGGIIQHSYSERVLAIDPVTKTGVIQFPHLGHVKSLLWLRMSSDVRLVRAQLVGKKVANGDAHPVDTLGQFVELQDDHPMNATVTLANAVSNAYVLNLTDTPYPRVDGIYFDLNYDYTLELTVESRTDGPLPATADVLVCAHIANIFQYDTAKVMCAQ
jgi:hypothetical protein